MRCLPSQGGRLLSGALEVNTALLRLQVSPMDGIDLTDLQTITAALKRNNVCAPPPPNPPPCCCGVPLRDGFRDMGPFVACCGCCVCGACMRACVFARVSVLIFQVLVA